MLVHYGIRLGWEIALFWVLSAASSIAMTGDSSPAICLGLARLETLAAVWITVRLLVAEDVFKTSGGWQARPVPAWVPPATQVIGLGMAFMLPWIVRVLLLEHQLGLDANGWGVLVKRVWWPQAMTWLAFATAVKLAAHFILRGTLRTQAIASGVLAVLTLVGTLRICTRATPTKDQVEILDRTNNPRKLAQGIQRLLPAATDFVGAWNDRVDPESKVPAAKLVLRLPIGNAGPLINARLLAAEASLQGVRAAVKVQLRSVDVGLLDKLLVAPAILRYADGTYGTCCQNRRHLNRKLGPRPDVEQFEFFGSFVSPLCLPEYDGDPTSLLAGAELLFFAEDAEAAPLDPTLERAHGQPYSTRTNLTLPPVRTPEESDPLAASTYQLIDWLNISWDFARSYSPPVGMVEQIQSLPAAALPCVLKRFPWSENAWIKLVHPFLLKHAGASDIPLLLDRLEFDPRLAVLFIEKGWIREAMPQLRRFAKDRLPLDPVCIGALAAERDPLLAADIAAVALQLDRGLAELMPALRNQPGLDWPAFVKTGWKNLKYQKRDNRDCFYQFMLWAAQEGEFSAFRALAESLAGVTKWQYAQASPPLQAIVAGEPPDLIGYLRENIDRMTFDPRTRKWTSSTH